MGLWKGFAFGGKTLSRFCFVWEFLGYFSTHTMRKMRFSWYKNKAMKTSLCLSAVACKIFLIFGEQLMLSGKRVWEAVAVGGLGVSLRVFIIASLCVDNDIVIKGHGCNTFCVKKGFIAAWRTSPIFSPILANSSRRLIRHTHVSLSQLEESSIREYLSL